MTEQQPKSILEAERPSKHGRILGSALALIAKAGRRDAPVDLPEMCLTCAFREGSMPNQMAGTGMIALNIVLGIDRDRFACHHGMKEGAPEKLCVGYVAAKLAPFSFTKEVLTWMMKELDAMDGEDDVRATFDSWVGALDPKQHEDVYALARKFERHKRAQATENPSPKE